MHLGDEVTEVTAIDGSGFHVATGKGKTFTCKAVVIAGGVGSFQPRPLRATGADECTGRSLHYRVQDPQQFAEREMLILGGGDSALDWVLALVDTAKHITLVHRRDEYRAMQSSVSRVRELAAAGRLSLMENCKAIAIEEIDGLMSSMTIQPKIGEAVQVAAEQALVFFGLAPKLGPIADWGLDINRKTINVDTEKFETSTPGIFAVGDINHYPGKKKLILCGFHEAALAAFAIKQQIEPERKVHVQYTTTSPIMHKRLGVPD
jgi:thioredoxin reductase (NADPH)